MYYVVKTYEILKPIVIETFEDLEDAMEYANIMHRSGKGDFTVLTEVVLQTDENE